MGHYIVTVWKRQDFLIEIDAENQEAAEKLAIEHYAEGECLNTSLNIISIYSTAEREALKPIDKDDVYHVTRR